MKSQELFFSAIPELRSIFRKSRKQVEKSVLFQVHFHLYPNFSFFSLLSFLFRREGLRASFPLLNFLFFFSRRGVKEIRKDEKKRKENAYLSARKIRKRIPQTQRFIFSDRYHRS